MKRTITEDMSKNKYRLQSLVSQRIFEDKGWILEGSGEETAGLIRAVYDQKQLNPGADDKGIFKFADWLPVNKDLKGSSAPVTYRSEGLAKSIGLKNLYITFSGYWPEKKAFMKTCSFKETEAYTVAARFAPEDHHVLVVASAGNTARAFARVCSDNNIPLLLCVPEDNINALWFDEEIKDNVKLIVSKKGSDYFDAIHLSNVACRSERFIPEGGAKNVARRDGMGTTVLSAVTSIGRIPDYYFQAVGSGTGAIAAWEANIRLIEDGRFGNKMMKLMVSQNYPFTPIYDAWKAGSREILAMDDDIARKQVAAIDAKVLSNRKPPYGIIGGLFDALSGSRGDVLLANNEEAIIANDLFQKTEGIDLHPAAAVATATLIEAVRQKHIEEDAVVMLNITGGGEERFKHDKQLHYLEPSLVFDYEPDPEEVMEKINKLF